MNQKIYQIDTFTDKVFAGNAAAVCPLERWLSDELMQKIANENNLSETAFYVNENGKFHIRWFTPNVEVDLCGHATLAAAFVIFNFQNFKENTIKFFSLSSGELQVTKNEDFLTLNFPTDLITEVEISTELSNLFDIKPKLALKGKTDYMLVFDNQDEIINIKPRFDLIEKVKARGIIITSTGTQSDFVSRFFAPQSGILEDPVTGSAHTTLIPYWSKVLQKAEMIAWQLSERKGYLKCKYLNERVEINGQAKLYLIGEIFINNS